MGLNLAFCCYSVLNRPHGFVQNPIFFPSILAHLMSSNYLHVQSFTLSVGGFHIFRSVTSYCMPVGDQFQFYINATEKKGRITRIHTHTHHHQQNEQPWSYPRNNFFNFFSSCIVVAVMEVWCNPIRSIQGEEFEDLNWFEVISHWIKKIFLVVDVACNAKWSLIKESKLRTRNEQQQPEEEEIQFLTWN